MQRGAKPVDFRAEGEAREWLVKSIVPAAIIALLIALLAYVTLEYGFGPFLELLAGSAYVAGGMLAGAVLTIALFRLYMRWRFFQHVVSRSVKASERNLPEIYRAAEQAAARLGVKAPGVYVVQDPQVNAFAMGLRRKIIVLNTGMIEATDGGELAFILGHELAHVKYGWTVQLRLPGLTLPLPLAFGSKRREYTCDRGGLLASRSLEKSVMVLAKLALGRSLAEKVDVSRFYAGKDEGEADRISRLSEALATHPPVKDRVLKLREFYASDMYRELASQP